MAATYGPARGAGSPQGRQASGSPAACHSASALSQVTFGYRTIAGKLRERLASLWSGAPDEESVTPSRIPCLSSPEAGREGSCPKVMRKASAPPAGSVAWAVSLHVRSYEDRRDVVCNSGVGSLRNTVMQLVEAGESS